MAQQKTVSGWTGWVAFAAIMLMVAGFFHVFAGVVGLFRDDIYVVGQSSVWLVDVAVWSWGYVVWGLLALLAGASLAKGNMYGRIIAVLVASTSAIFNLMFVPIYPIWSILMIVIDVCVIYAVTVYGDEMKNLS